MTDTPQTTVSVAPSPTRTGPPVGRIVLTVVGAILVVVGLALGAVGSVLVWAHATQRDADGYFTSDGARLETVTYAITSPKVDLGVRPGADHRRFDLGDLATVRLRVQADGGGQVFVGIGPADEVERYLAGVGHVEIVDVDLHPFAASLRLRPGDAPSSAPARQSLWSAAASGSGVQTLEWPIESGDWAVVVMNADGSAGVGVEASVGVKADWVLPAGAVALGAALAVLALGAVLLVIGATGLGQRVPVPVPASAPGAVRLEGAPDASLSRWLWLVKWLLLIPHLIALVVLWIAFAVVTVVAGFAIVVTGRYPRPLFAFNLGVLRWTWRVAFYSFGAFGTDRYPPFTLGAAPDYPATFDIAYPEHLSRGLVLVKWWLLAVPHYVVVAILGGGAFAGWAARGEGWALGGTGLIGWLVLVAAVVLLFTGRYPSGIFDLVVGLDRWVYRVIPYAALMTDEYPPFRLDQGGAEPATPLAATAGMPPPA